MKEINELLKKNNLKPISYTKKGKVLIVKTTNNSVVIKENNIDSKILEYLNSRNVNFLPDTIFDSKYLITKYEQDIDIPNEQKILDLIDLISLMHNKTSFYKEEASFDYKTIYEELINNYEYLYEYYSNYISRIDDKVFYSPSEFLLSSNISCIFRSIEEGRKYIEAWYKEVETINKMRVSVIHNNLDLTHFIRNKKSYLISFDKAKIDIPVFDLYKLYNKYYLDFNFTELLRQYEKDYKLSDSERKLLFALILMPNKIEHSDEYTMCINISNEIDRLYKGYIFIDQYKKSINN